MNEWRGVAVKGSVAGSWSARMMRRNDGRACGSGSQHCTGQTCVESIKGKAGTRQGPITRQEKPIRHGVI